MVEELSTSEQQVQNLMLFDRPKIRQPSESIPSGNTTQGSTASAGSSSVKSTQSSVVSQQQREQQMLRLVFEKDCKNEYLVTNPAAIFKFLRHDRFLNLAEDEQLLIISRLDEILEKCPYNPMIISEQVDTMNVSRSNQETLDYYRKLVYSGIKPPRDPNKTKALKIACSSQDIIFQLIHIGLRFTGKSAIKTIIADKILQILGKLCQGRRFLKCHLELVYQYIKSVVNKILAKLGGLQGLEQKKTINPEIDPEEQFEGYHKMQYCLKLLTQIISKKREVGASNYFYFSGFLSGILLNQKPMQTWPFIKGFSVCLWFKINQYQPMLQDPQNLPVLFNCFSYGFGGFECYFNQNKLYYRILPPNNYQPPNTESNGVQISEFSVDKWYFLGLEHDKPYLARANLSAVVNDKQIINFPMDYPKFDSNQAKLNMVSVCTNLVGQLSTFMLFREQISNPQKFVQIYKNYQFGIGDQNEAKFQEDQAIFDQALKKKLLLIYTPMRTMQKTVYDYIDINDGKLLFNCGTWVFNKLPFLRDSGGIDSLIPLLENIKILVAIQSKRDLLSQKQNEKLETNGENRSSQLVNSFLELVLTTVSSGQADLGTDPSQNEDLETFIKLLIHTLSSLPVSNPNVLPIDCETIQNLAELRFTINDALLSEKIFVHLMHTADFWINTHNFELINEFWSFMKAIYSQDPVRYNRAFPVQNLLDFMLKICESTRDGAFCCEYHKSNYQMLFSPQLTGTQTFSNTKGSLQLLDQKTEDRLAAQDQKKANQLCHQDGINFPVYQINKYLEPIAGILEYVLTSGGEEILNQIQYLAKSLTVKSCSCYHIQVLKLLKVLLLDSNIEVNEHSRPIQFEFATKFIDVKGLQILLYLCQNATFDVKAMCIKLIDVLSMNPSLVQMRIDTDLVTYLSHVILPEQLVNLQLTKKHQFLHLMLQDEEVEAEDRLNDDGGNTSDYRSRDVQMYDYQAQSDNEAEVYESELIGQSNLSPEVLQRRKGSHLFNFNKNVSDDQNEYSQFREDEEAEQYFVDKEPFLKAPKAGKRQMAPLFMDSEEEKLDIQEEQKKNYGLTESLSPYKTSMMSEEQIGDKLAQSPNVKQKAGKTMFNFGVTMEPTQFESKSPPQCRKVTDPIGSSIKSPDNDSQPQYRAGQRPLIKAIEIPDDDSQEENDAKEQKSFLFQPPQKRNKMKFGLNVATSDNSENEFQEQEKSKNEAQVTIKKDSNLGDSNFSTQKPSDTKPLIGKNKGLNIEVSDDEDFDQFMPPTREQHERRFGDKLLGDYDDDNGARNTRPEKDDSKPPKPTADVLMSRNLRGGANKGFDFGFQDDDDDDDEEQEDVSSEKDKLDSYDKQEDGEEEEQDDQPLQNSVQNTSKTGFKLGSYAGKKLNLLHNQGQNKNFNKIQNIGGQTEDRKKKKFIAPMIITDEKFARNAKPPLNIDTEEDTKQKQAVKGRKNLGLNLAIEDSNLGIDDDNKEFGNTGATNDLDLDVLSHSSNDAFQLPKPSLSYRERNSLKSKKKFKNSLMVNLMIDTESINKNFNFGGEKGDFQPEFAHEKLESDIQELAQKCVDAMKRSTADKPKTRFEKLLQEEVDQMDSDDFEQMDNQDFDLNKDKLDEVSDIFDHGNPQHRQLLLLEDKNLEDEDNLDDADRRSSIKGEELSYTDLFKNRNNRKGSDCSEDFDQSSNQFGNGAGANNKLKHMFNEAQSVRGLKRIEIKEDQKQQMNAKAGLKINTFVDEDVDKTEDKKKITLTNIVEEELTPHSDQSNRELEFSDQVIRNGPIQSFGEANDYQKGKKKISKTDQKKKLKNAFMNGDIFGENCEIDAYTLELENLYTSCLEWLLNRPPGSLNKNLLIDDNDKISFQPALQIMMTLVSYSNNLVRQRALQDMHTLSQLDFQNGQIILQHPKFHTWLLELLMPYQDFIAVQQILSDSSRAVYDMGCKLHTLLLKTACCNPEEDGLKKVNMLVRWPQYIHEKSASQTNFQNKEEQLINQSHEFETANSLVRVLLVQLLSTLKDEAMRQGLAQKGLRLSNSIHKNLITMVLQIEELVFSSHGKTFEAENVSKESSRSNAKRTSERPYSDVNESIFKWLQRDYLFFLSGSFNSADQTQNLWAEWDLMEALFQQLQYLFPQDTYGIRQKEQESNFVEVDSKTVQNLKNNPIEIQKQVFELLQDKAGVEYSNDIDILMFDSNPQNVLPIQKQQNQSYGFSLLSRISKSTSQTSSQKQDSQSFQMQTNSGSENTFLKSMMNLVCVTIEMCDTKSLSQVWLDRLERIVKHLIIVSEKWTCKNEQHFIIVQKKIAESIAFAFAFLFHEVNNAGTPKSQPSQNTMMLQMNPPSPQEQVQRSKLFSQLLKNLLVFLCNVVHYSNQLNEKINPNVASRQIFQHILVKEYLCESKTTIESLVSEQDIEYLRESNFEDFPERFHQNDWKVTFFHNQLLQQITKQQLNLKSLQNFDIRRKAYAKRVLETTSKNQKAKEEILKRIQEETVDAIGSLNEDEFERKNKEAFFIDFFIRERFSEQKKHFKHVLGAKGAWRIKWPITFKKTLMQDSGEGTQTLMKDIPSNAFKYINDTPSVSKNLLKEIHNEQYANFNDIVLQSNNLDKIIQLNDQEQENELDDSALLIASDPEEMKEKMEKSKEQLTVLKPKPRECFMFFKRQLTLFQKKDLQKFYLSYLKQIFFSGKNPKRKELIESKCQILTPLLKKETTVLMTNYELVFFYDMDLTDSSTVQPKNNIFFFDWKLKPTQSYQKIVNLSSIKEIQRRIFLTQRTGLELFLMNNESLLLNFPDPESRDQFAKKILRQRKSKCKNLKYYTSLDPKWILKKKELTEQWQNWKISNFEYLMQLNQLAGRSYQDLSQYPVFPWLFSNYGSRELPDLSALNKQPRGGAPPGQFRDFTKNMQLLGSAQRQAEFKRKYEDAEGFIGLDDRFHCGSHFSNPGIVLHYLSRVNPFNEANIELHGKTLDHPERVFFSLEKSFENAKCDFTDVRELTPQFFYLPEMFQNLNKFNFGKKQDGQTVSSVILPPWADANACKFVQVMREGFESKYVSANLHTWIDYIFGCKQRDQEAVNSLNTFSKITYAPEKDGDFDINSVVDPILRSAYESQCYNYGQTPTQLFKNGERHPCKKSQLEALYSNLVVDIVTRLKVFKPVLNNSNSRKDQQQQISPDAILTAKFIGDCKIAGVTKDDHVQHFIWLPRAHEMNPSTPFSLGGDRKTKFSSQTSRNGIYQIDRSIKKFDLPMLIINDGKYVVRGGYWDGKVQFSPAGEGNETSFALTQHQSTVSAIAINDTEQILITGTKTGEVVIWKNSEFEYQNESFTYMGDNSCENSKNSWFVFKRIHDHERQVSSIFISNEMCLFVTGSFDGTANLYNLYSGKFIRTFSHPNLSPIYSVLLAQNPLAICAFFSREDHMWNSYQINGELLTDFSRLKTNQERLTNQKVLTEECSHVISLLVIKDSQHMDKLVYGTEKGHIVLRMLPSMLKYRRLQVGIEQPVLSVVVSPDRRFLHVGCGDGGLVVIQAK